jgi:hypothetical protein
MTAPVRPASVPTLAHDNWVFVPSIANQAAPTVAEITAGSAIDITQMMIEPDCVLPTITPQTATANLRIGDTVQYEFLAPGKPTSGVIGFSFNPQAAPGDSSRKLYDAWAGGVSGFLVNRRGLPIATAFAAAQMVTVYPVQVSAPQQYTSGTGASAESAAKSTAAYSAPASPDVAIAA